MTSLKRLITENIENRINTTRLDALMQKLAEELTQKEQDKLAEPYVELIMMIDTLNKTPHTIFNNDQWSLFKLVFVGKVAEVMLVLDEISEKNKKADCAVVKGALELLLTY